MIRDYVSQYKNMGPINKPNFNWYIFRKEWSFFGPNRTFYSINIFPKIFISCLLFYGNKTSAPNVEGIDSIVKRLLSHFFYNYVLTENR